MNDIHYFGEVILVVSLAAVLAVMSNRVSERIQLPAPAIFFGFAVLATAVRPSLADVPLLTVERVVTVAVAAILFDGGMDIGLKKLRGALGVISTVGVVGTFATTAAVALVAHPSSA